MLDRNGVGKEGHAIGTLGDQDQGARHDRRQAAAGSQGLLVIARRQTGEDAEFHTIRLHQEAALIAGVVGAFRIDENALAGAGRGIGHEAQQ